MSWFAGRWTSEALSQRFEKSVRGRRIESETWRQLDQQRSQPGSEMLHFAQEASERLVGVNQPED